MIIAIEQFSNHNISVSEINWKTEFFAFYGQWYLSSIATVSQNRAECETYLQGGFKNQGYSQVGQILSVNLVGSIIWSLEGSVVDWFLEVSLSKSSLDWLTFRKKRGWQIGRPGKMCSFRHIMAE